MKYPRGIENKNKVDHTKKTILHTTQKMTMLNRKLFPFPKKIISVRIICRNANMDLTALVRDCPFTHINLVPMQIVG